MHGRCGFYEWQKDYLGVLVSSGIIVKHLDVVEEAPDEVIEEVNSVGNGPVGNACVFYEGVQTCTLERKIEHLTWAVKMMAFVLVAIVVLVCVWK